MKYELGIIGFGVMGQAIVSRFLADNKLAPEKICVFDLDKEKIKSFSYPVIASDNLQDMVNNSDRILFAVKPQHYKEAINGIDFASVSTVITIMAGVQVNTLRNNIGKDIGILRVMPNTPCALGKGVCALFFDKVDNEEKEILINWFGSCGDTIIITEDKFDAVTGVSGSGPAYVYTFAQGMIEGGIRGGLSYEESKTLALNTLIGAAELAKKSNENLDVLIDKVCSKGGTTIEAVNVYRDKNLTGIIADGIDACRNKSKLLSENNK